MTEFNVEVVRLDHSEKHPNADTLSIAHVFDGYPVIYKSDSFNVGDKVAYVPIDSIVPLENPLFSFLSEDKGKTHARIKAKKLRGVFSMGMLVPADKGWDVGQNVQEALGITKWEPPPPKQFRGSLGPSDQARDPGIIPVYTDLDGLRKYKNVLEENELVTITEKIHGANARFVYGKDEFWCGSHKQFKKEHENNAWWKVAKKYNLEEILKDRPDIAVYGEIYGTVQDLRYEVPEGEVHFKAFDIMDVKTGKYYDTDQFEETCDTLNIPRVPVLYRGPWNLELMKLAEGKSTLAPSHVREGIVIRPKYERWNDRMGRVILKLVGEGYLLRKNA